MIGEILFDVFLVVLMLLIIAKLAATFKDARREYYKSRPKEQTDD